MRGDGDGWVEGADGGRRWGRFGAAGLLVRAPGDSPDDVQPLVLLQLRVSWSHHGGTWGLPGGARDSDETPEQAALREAAEEAALDPTSVHPRATHAEGIDGDLSGWTYTTVIADAARALPTVANHESEDLRWVPEADVAELPLHPGLRHSWPRLAAEAHTLVVDTANLLGSVPDGWWRDRAGATERLLESLALAVPRTVPLSGGFAWAARVIAVVEGAARDIPATIGRIELVRAPGSGDDALAELVERLERVERPLVVTADRGLRARLPPGVAVIGPGVVRDWLAGPA